jgi:small ligand-binding sensory domain FIST
MGRLLEGLVCRRRERGDGAAKGSQLRCGLAHEFHKDFALPSALAATAAHDFLPVVRERLDVPLQCGCSGGAVLRAGQDELKDFFCALDRVVASVTR